MHECSFPKGMDLKINDIPVEPCNFVEIESYRNVTVQILKCQKCGKISVGWKRQDNTEEIEEGDSYGT